MEIHGGRKTYRHRDNILDKGPFGTAHTAGRIVSGAHGANYGIRCENLPPTRKVYDFRLGSGLHITMNDCFVRVGDTLYVIFRIDYSAKCIEIVKQAGGVVDHEMNRGYGLISRPQMLMSTNHIMRENVSEVILLALSAGMTRPR